MAAVLLADDDTSGARFRRAVASAATALPSPGVRCSSASAGAPRPIAWPAAIADDRALVQREHELRSSGSPARNGTSVEPGLEKIVVSPRRRSTSNVASRTVGADTTSPYCKTFGLLPRIAVRSRSMAHGDVTRRPGGRFPRAATDASEQIALEIRRYLERRDLQPGDRIGTEQELAAEFGVSRPTLREAPAAARQLAPDPRRPRPLRRHLRRAHAERGHEPQRQRVDRD